MQQLINRSRLFLGGMILYLLPLAGFAQSVQRKISNDKWQKLINDPAFGYKTEHELKNTSSGQGKLFFQIFNAIANFFTSVYGRITIIVVAVSVILFVVYKILSSGQFTFKKTKKNETEILQEGEELAVTNWELLSQQAIKDGDLRLALRYNYMWLLQLLEKRSLIQYRIDKTNYDYYKELSATRHQQPFKELSRQYEYAWYGHIPVSAAALESYMNQFNNLKKQLS